MEVTVKIIVAGDGGVGKTSLRKRYMGETFSSNYMATIGADFSMKRLEYPEAVVRFQIWDIAGQKAYSSITPIYYQRAVGVIVTYSRTDRASVGSIKKWMDAYFAYNQYEGNTNPVLILANKSDLSTETDFISDQEHEEIIQNLRESYPDTQILDMHTSALTGENVNKAFDSFGRLCFDWIIEASQSQEDI